MSMHRCTWLALGLAATLYPLSWHSLGCSSPIGKAIEATATRLGCSLVGVLAGGEEVGTLCDDIASEVEHEIAAMGGGPSSQPSALLAHQARAHRPRVRLTVHVPNRDPGETVEEGVPLEATLRVLRRRGLVGPQAAPNQSAGAGR